LTPILEWILNSILEFTTALKLGFEIDAWLPNSRHSHSYRLSELRRGQPTNNQKKQNGKQKKWGLCCKRWRLTADTLGSVRPKTNKQRGAAVHQPSSRSSSGGSGDAGGGAGGASGFGESERKLARASVYSNPSGLAAPEVGSRIQISQASKLRASDVCLFNPDPIQLEPPSALFQGHGLCCYLFSFPNAANSQACCLLVYVCTLSMCLKHVQCFRL
jgi:hypothetical protein